MSCLSVDGASSSAKGYYMWVGPSFKHTLTHSSDICRAPTWNLAFYKV